MGIIFPVRKYLNPDFFFMNKEQHFNQLVSRSKEIINAGGSRDDILKEICVLLHKEVDVYDWVGFYIADPDKERELYLGPYVGAETDHTRIPFGVGICGQVAESLKTFVVDDVNAQDNYLSCSVEVKSEIVVPILKDGAFVAQLDIDSNTLAAMDETDQKAHEEICDMLAGLF